jgi:hypothetical protein
MSDESNSSRCHDCGDMPGAVTSCGVIGGCPYITPGEEWVAEYIERYQKSLRDRGVTV